MINKKGMEAHPMKVKAMLGMQILRTKKEVQNYKVAWQPKEDLPLIEHISVSHPSSVLVN